MAKWTSNDERQYEHIKEGLRTRHPRMSLDDRTRQELYNLARERQVPGRSGMTKAELIAGIRARQ